MKRRSFLELVGLAGASCFLPAISSCSSAERQGKLQSEKEDRPYSDKDGYHFMRPHNWALMAWAEDIINGTLPSSGNIILHPDTHHDIYYAKRTRAIDAQQRRTTNLNVVKSGPPLEQISDKFIDIFVKPDHYSNTEKLAIARKEAEQTEVGNFIIKAFAVGITDEVYWARPKWDFTLRKGPGTTFYALRKIDDELYQVHKSKNRLQLAGANRVLAVHEIDAESIADHARQSSSYIWDVDLDYFSCSGDGAKEWIKVKDLMELGSKLERMKKQYGPKFVVKEEFKDLVDHGLGIESLKKHFGPKFEVRGELARNIMVPVYRASDDEIASETMTIRQIEKELPVDRPFSKTLALSPRFTFDDQEETLIEKYCRKI